MQKESVRNITQKEAFLKYLQRMDIEMLEIILDDSITYFGTTKKIFIQKLSYIFNQVQLAGERGFLSIKQDKKQTNTYYLLLQIFSYANKFIIDEKEGNIIKIYGTKIKKSKEDIENLNPLELFFGDDEKIDFKPSNEYVMKLYRCTKAYEELVNDKIQILNSEAIAEWLRKHKLLFEEIKDEYLMFKFNDFRDLYLMFEYLLEELQNYNEVKMALKSYNESNVTSMYQWLVDCYRLAFCRVLHFESAFSDINLENKNLKYIYRSNIYFKGDDFFAILKFNELYHRQYGNYQTVNTNAE